MTDLGKKEKWINWSCRVLFVLDMYFVISGYLSWYQTKDQLVSPLIPKTTIIDIMEDSKIFEASIVSSLFMLAGILFYTFNKKIISLILLCMAPLYHEFITLFLAS